MRADDRGAWLDQKQRMSGRGLAELDGELVEIIPQGNDLRRHARTLQRACVPRKSATRGASCAEQLAFELCDVSIRIRAEPERPPFDRYRTHCIRSLSLR